MEQIHGCRTERLRGIKCFRQQVRALVLRGWCWLGLEQDCDSHLHQCELFEKRYGNPELLDDGLARGPHPVLQAMRNVDDERNAYQLCELELHYAKQGDDAFTRELYEFVGRRPFSDSSSIGMEQLLRAGGEKGLLFIAGLRGKELATEEWEWYDGSIIDSAIEKWGEERVRALLESSTDPNIRRFADAWNETTESRDQSGSSRPSRVEMLQSYSAEDVIRAAQAEEQAPWLSLRGWGMHAESRELLIVQEHLWTETTPRPLSRLLRIFSNRPLPEFDARLIDLCHHADVDVRRWAANALENNTHALVRQFALEQLAHPTIDRSAVGFFIRNYEEGDDQRLLEQLPLPDDSWERHSLLLDLLKVLEQNEAADSSKLGQVIYFHTPCQMCRCYAARLLYRKSVAPDWLIEECLLDANEDCHCLDEPDDDETGES
jgi:hypothetical protein